MKRHPQAFAWFREQAAAGRLQITWVNHTLSHPYEPQLDLNHNFMREAGIDPLKKILGLEQLLVRQGIAPSVFFRFPGLFPALNSSKPWNACIWWRLVAMPGWPRGRSPKPAALF